MWTKVKKLWKGVRKNRQRQPQNIWGPFPQEVFGKVFTEKFRTLSKKKEWLPAVCNLFYFPAESPEGKLDLVSFQQKQKIQKTSIKNTPCAPMSRFSFRFQCFPDDNDVCFGKKQDWSPVYNCAVFLPATVKYFMLLHCPLVNL